MRLVSPQTLGSTAHIYDHSHPHEKLGLREQKCIFILYYKHSKEYKFVGKNVDRSWSEIVSQDAMFVEYEFPNKGDVERDV